MEKRSDKKIDITYTDADTAITLQHIEDGTTDLAIIDVAMYNAYQKEYNYDIVANQISDDDAKAIADNSYAYYIFPKDQEELRDKVDEQLKELKKDGTLAELSQKYFRIQLRKMISLKKHQTNINLESRKEESA